MLRTRSALGFALALGVGIATTACDAAAPMGPPGSSLLGTDAGVAVKSQSAANMHACWGQATQVFARMGLMGEHASQQPTPRLGLRNLARSLHDAGILPDDSMQALGVFVAEALGLAIDACAGERSDQDPAG